MKVLKSGVIAEECWRQDNQLKVLKTEATAKVLKKDILLIVLNTRVTAESVEAKSYSWKFWRRIVTAECVKDNSNRAEWIEERLTADNVDHQSKRWECWPTRITAENVEYQQNHSGVDFFTNIKEIVTVKWY